MDITKISDLLKFLYNTLGQFVSLLLFVGVIFTALSLGMARINETHKINIFSYWLVEDLYMIGIWAIFLGLLFALSHFIVSLVRMMCYRIKYPTHSLDKKYYLVSFNGTAYLFDKNTKEIRWIESWLTASDLRFNGRWTFINQSLSDYWNNTDPPLVRTTSGGSFNLDEYHWGEGIRTRAIPGS